MNSMPDPNPEPHSELATFGEELRREREIRGISLKEISDATKISKRFLEAIERNDHRTLPAPVFTRGFVREYARYLGLNTEEIVNRYNFAAAGDDRIEQSQHLERLAQRDAPPPPKRGIPPWYARIDRNIYVLLLIVMALGGATYFAIQHKRPAAEAARIETAIAPRPVRRTPAALANPVPPAPAVEPMHLAIDLAADSWVVLDADGKEVLNERLRRGDRRLVQANDSFHFQTIGNAGGVTLTLNGVTLPSLGADGQVIKDKIVDRSSLKTP